MLELARTLASRVGAMGYTITQVGKADRFDYPKTTVYYGPGGEGVGVRLPRQLSVFRGDAGPDPDAAARDRGPADRRHDGLERP